MNPLNKLNCVMLVDDDEPTNFINEMVIKKADCAKHIRVFDYAETALEYLTRSMVAKEEDSYYQKPDLILLDINMPRTNAWEFIDQYRRHPDNNAGGIIIMMLTTSLNPEDEQKAANIREISGFYHKPLTSKMLDDILSKFFAAQK